MAENTTGKVKRQGVTVNLPKQSFRVQGSGFGTQLAPNYQAGMPESGDAGLVNMMSSLADAMPYVAEQYNQYQKGEQKKLAAQIEEDVTLQENRRLMGLDPTADATKQGLTAARAVDVRNAAQETIGRLTQLAKTFDGTDEEWSQVVAEEQGKIYDMTGDDTDLIAAGAGIYRTGLHAVTRARSAGKERIAQEELYRSNSDSLRLAVVKAADADQARTNVASVLAEMELGGVHDEMVEKTLVDTAISMANDLGETTLIDFIKEQTDWYNENPALIAAHKNAQNKAFMESYGEIASTQSAIEAKYSNNPTLTEEQWYKEAGALRNNGKPIYSVPQLREKWKQMRKGNNDEYRTDLLYKHMLASQGNDEADPVAIVAGDISPKQEKALITKLDEQQAKQYQMWLSANPDANDADKMAYQTSQVQLKADLLSRMGIKDQNWEAQFESLENVDLTNLTAGENRLPIGVANAISTLDSLSGSPAALKNHASNKTISIYTNFKKNLDYQMDEVSAFQLAHRIANEKRVVNADQRKKITSRVKSSLDEEFDRWFFEAGDDIGSVQRDLFQYDLETRAEELVGGGVNPEDAVERAVAELNAETYQLQSGTVIRGNIQNIARRMGASVVNADKFLSELPERIADDFELDDDFVINPNIPTEEWIPVIKDNGTVIYTDYLGVPVTRPLTLPEVAGKSIKQQIEDDKNREALIEKQRMEDYMPYTMPMRTSVWE